MSEVEDAIAASVRDALAKLSRQQRAESDQKFDALKEVFDEVSTGIASIVQILESKGEGDNAGEIIAAIGKAITGIKFPEPKVQVTVEAPIVNVEAPNVTLEPRFDVPQPLVQVIERAAAIGWDIDFKYDGPTNLPSGIRMMRINPPKG